MLQVVCNLYRQKDIWIDINSEEKVAVILSKMTVILSKMFFYSSKPFHAHVQYVFNASEKYKNLSTNSSGIVVEMIREDGDMDASMSRDLAAAIIRDGKVPSDWEQ